ncbi:T9SS type B sorting domain-containing protein [Tenacibaculum tangerinum]|uniref:T9SS type B sorting domain-containing protein n=1 Tax=Tenacibaculum tangerinum TaxID=3038772 RepID=A0ABY8L6U0_9FLAO|nr:T9SS type B sorting domain-containing protein [Tenacibaculum tangerinum]WGH75913.1 T9SS type B sorting domain-containing protein [Tenacibaculum tangerinum]
MKKIVFIFLILSTSLSAQKEANIWYFGEYVGLDFNSGSPTLLLDGKLNTEGGCATISDTNGKLLFYTDGRTVWNKNHQTMLNGTGLNGGNRSTHSALVVPKPSDLNKYYIFTVDDFIGNNGLQYSEVDMTLDGGLGGITSIKNVLLHTPTTEKITAIQSSVANEYWVVSHKWGNNEFIAFKVSSLGIDPNPVISAVGTTVNNDGASIGQIKIAPNGKKIAVARFPSISEVQIFDFDTSTGKVSNPLTLLKYSNDEQIYGLEFSPNSELLYTAVNYEGIFQFNLQAGSPGDIVNSKVKLSTTTVSHDSFQLASDGKIYIAGFAQSYLDVINNPNTLGLGANYVSEALYLGGRISFSGLPVFIQSFFTINFQSKNHCLGDATSFNVSNLESYDNILWDFGDGNTSTQENPIHTFLSAGNYDVTLSVTSGGQISSETKTVTIYKQPVATKPYDILLCDFTGDISFDLVSHNINILNGLDSNIFGVNYYEGMVNYTSGIKINTPEVYTNASSFFTQEIIAEVYNKQNPACNDITDFNVGIYKTPQLESPSNLSTLTQCDNADSGSDNDSITEFDLTAQEQYLLLNGTNSNVSYNYYTDAELKQPIASPNAFPNTQNPQTIYVEAVSNENSQCTTTTSFTIEVLELPSVASTVELKQCDNADINGFSSINLNEAKKKIVSNPEDFTITFFEEKNHAENNTNPISNPTAYTNQTVSNDTVWARVENTHGCFRVSEVELIISTTQIPVTFSKIFYRCDDGIDTTDGVATFGFSAVTQEVKNLFPANQQLIINYYRNEADALAELNAITNITNYQNIGYPNQQNIYIRVDSALDNDCLGLGHHITLRVEKVPVANPVTINPECDNDRDGVVAFDTSTIQNTIISNQTDVAVSYFDKNGMPLPSPLPNPFTTATQTVTARIVNTASQDLNGKCYSETTISFVVNSVPVANKVATQEQCDDDFDGIADFDTSSIESTILGTQTGMIVNYFDENDNQLPSPLPNPLSTNSQMITVRVENPQYAICYDETTIDFEVKEKPNFDLQSEAIICVNEASPLELKVDNPNGNYSYEWKDESGNPISNLITASVSKGGIYFVKATSDVGCESEIKSIQVKESSIANITINHLEIIDDSENNSIRINTQNAGLGNYEFSLLDADSNIMYDYQEIPFFDNLEGGVYTVLIKDINGCGVQFFEISIINYPKFFTPNNDGINDTWHIKGIGKSFYKSGRVTIYNRFGKILKILSVNDVGWDGFYNGQKLPSNDYWFYAELIDPKGHVIKKKGNFSLLMK